MAHTHLYLLFTCYVGLPHCWRIVLSHWNPPWVLCLVFLRGAYEDEDIQTRVDRLSHEVQSRVLLLLHGKQRRQMALLPRESLYEVQRL